MWWLRVVDVERAITLYKQVLGCVVVRRRDDLGLTYLRAGASMIHLVVVDGVLGRRGGIAAGRVGRNVDHLCLRTEPFDEACLRAHLAVHGVAVDGPVPVNSGAEGEGPSLYLRDPDGNTLALKGASGG